MPRRPSCGIRVCLQRVLAPPRLPPPRLPQANKVNNQIIVHEGASLTVANLWADNCVQAQSVPFTCLATTKGACMVLRLAGKSRCCLRSMLSCMIGCPPVEMRGCQARNVDWLPSCPLFLCPALPAGGWLTFRDSQISDASCLHIKRSDPVNSAALAFRYMMAQSQGQFEHEYVDHRWAASSGWGELVVGLQPTGVDERKDGLRLSQVPSGRRPPPDALLHRPCTGRCCCAPPTTCKTCRRGTTGAP